MTREVWTLIISTRQLFQCGVQRAQMIQTSGSSSKLALTRWFPQSGNQRTFLCVTSMSESSGGKRKTGSAALSQSKNPSPNPNGPEHTRSRNKHEPAVTSHRNPPPAAPALTGWNQKELISGLLMSASVAPRARCCVVLFVWRKVADGHISGSHLHLHWARPPVQQSAAAAICFNWVHARACAAGWKDIINLRQP